jgi:hypothetical protein
MTKGFKSAISKIAQDTFNTGQNKFAVQFTQSCKKGANYLQRTSASEGYLVAKTVRMEGNRRLRCQMRWIQTHQMRLT